MKGNSSFRNYRSDRLSDKDLEDIRGMIWECFGEFSEMITNSTIRPESEYLDTDEVAELTGFAKTTLEAYRSRRMGPPVL